MKHDTLPDRVKSLVPSDVGQDLFLKSWNEHSASGESPTVALAMAWSDLAKAGYSENDEGVWLTKASGAKPVYLKRSVMNAERIHEWAAEQGFETALDADDMHVTVIYSKDAFSKWITERADDAYDNTLSYGNIVIRGGHRSIERLGENGEAVALRIESPELASENAMYRTMGASTDWPDFKPHITITWNAADLDVASVKPFDGDIVLGELVAKPMNENWRDNISETPLSKNTDSHQVDLVKQVCQEKGLLDRAISAIIDRIMGSTEINKSAKGAKILKLDDEQRIVWGWAYVSTEKGKLQVDTQGHSIEPVEMEKMANHFMLGDRSGKAMHVGKQRGTIIHSMPLTNELMKAFDIQSDREGWIIAYKVHDDEVWELVKSGTFSGFSIGGVASDMEDY